MCSKMTPVGEEKQRTRTSTRNKKRSVDDTKKKKKKKKKPRDSTNKGPSNLGPSRKIRTRTRKPKYLSLRLELTTSQHESRADNNRRKKKPRKHQIETITTDTIQCTEKENKEQLDLFPLHPETLSDKEGSGGYQYDAVTAYLFNSATDSTISSIHDLLDSSSAGMAVTAPECGGGILSPYDHRDHGSSSSSSLVRTAMRRGASEEALEERWVSYSEVVEEVMSRSGTPRWCGGGDDGDEDSGGIVPASLALKLDYEQIMEAWSDKGPLYVDGEPPQTVPDLHAHGLREGSVWAVPEMEAVERMKRGRREASLLRYKEKRQSRLFSKRIRYQVRKLNAEKRPRIKGRFVKRAET